MIKRLLAKKELLYWSASIALFVLLVSMIIAIIGFLVRRFEAITSRRLLESPPTATFNFEKLKALGIETK